MIAIGFLVATNLWMRLLAPVLRVVNSFSPPSEPGPYNRSRDMSSTAAPLTLRRSLALVWRTLRSMRTALVLLLLLALAAVAGRWCRSRDLAGRGRRDVPRPSGAANIYKPSGCSTCSARGGSPSSTCCSCLAGGLPAAANARVHPQPRTRRSRPASWTRCATTPSDPCPAARPSDRALGARPSPQAVPRAARSTVALAADKGLAREGGSLMFHWAFFLVLLGRRSSARAPGSPATRSSSRGSRWTEADANYDGNLREGRFASIDDHTGVQVCVKSFLDTYHQSGQPMDFVTTAELPIGRAASRSASRSIRVNHPARSTGSRCISLGFGWAPVVQVHEGDEAHRLRPAPVREGSRPRGASASSPSPGTARSALPTTEPQTGLQLVLWPTAAALANAITRQGPPVMMTTADHPVLLMSAYRGDLASELRPQSAQLDTRGLTRWGTPQALPQGTTFDLTSGAARARRDGGTATSSR